MFKPEFTVANWPKEKKGNCLIFAIGDSCHKLDDSYDIARSFEIACESRKFSPRRIDSIDEAREDEYVFLVFDFTIYNRKTPWGVFPTSDFHVVRRELDGTWVHKPGWQELPCTIKDEDWEPLYKEFGRKYVLFAATAEGAE